MANTEMIRDYIRASGYKMQYVARALKINPNALNLKLQGRTLGAPASNPPKRYYNL